MDGWVPSFWDGLFAGAFAVSFRQGNIMSLMPVVPFSGPGRVVAFKNLKACHFMQLERHGPWDLAKLLYFTNLDFPEIRGFPLLNHHLG